MSDNKFGENLLWFLHDVSCAEAEQIDSPYTDIHGETDSGADTSCEIDIRELCGSAHNEIQSLREQLEAAEANRSFIVKRPDNVFMQHTFATSIQECKELALSRSSWPDFERFEKEGYKVVPVLPEAQPKGEITDTRLTTEFAYKVVSGLRQLPTVDGAPLHTSINTDTVLNILRRVALQENSNG